tara:strand:- start:203 stop:472 length:270 start_codon:yes stop_codon:yes gene_type:complete
MCKNFAKGSFHKYGQKSTVKKISKQKKVTNFNIFFFKDCLLSMNIRIKKVITINGEIIPTTLTSITKEQVNAESKAFLYEGVSKKFITK